MRKDVAFAFGRGYNGGCNVGAVDAVAAGGTAMKNISIICMVVFLLCLLALPAIGYVSGRQCTPLTAIFVVPAEIVPLLTDITPPE